LDYWADLGDNRIGPILKDLVAAIDETDSADLLQRLSVRLKFMAGSVNSLAKVHAAKETARKPAAKRGGR